MKQLKEDIIFSKFIRNRDKRCKRCGRLDGLQCSHYYGRTRQTVRFDERNSDALCFGCHRFWELEDREAYREFKIKQLGQAEFDKLTVLARKTLKDIGLTKSDLKKMVIELYKRRVEEFT